MMHHPVQFHRQNPQKGHTPITPEQNPSTKFQFPNSPTTQTCSKDHIPHQKEKPIKTHMKFPLKRGHPKNQNPINLRKGKVGRFQQITKYYEMGHPASTIIETT